MDPVYNFDYKTGTELLQQIAGVNIGKFSAQLIDADIAARGANSEMGQAVVLMDAWSQQCAVDFTDLNDGEENALDQALRWFAVYRYKSLSMTSVRNEGGSCKDADYAFLNRAYDETTRNLCFSPKFSCMVEKVRKYVKGLPADEVKSPSGYLDLLDTDVVTNE